MRRFNFTGRKKILSEDINITLKSDEKVTPIVDIAVDLSRYGFKDAVVIIEAQRMTRFQRFKLGNVQQQKLRLIQQVLEQFDDAQGLQFKIKVKNEDGKLLGYAQNIKPYSLDSETEQFNSSILQVRSKDLSRSGELWRVSAEDDSYVLEIEKALGSRELVVRSLLFKSFILPAAMRTILEKILSDDDWDEQLTEISSEDDKWLIFASKLNGGVMPERDEDSKLNWIDDAIRGLVRNINIRDAAIEEMSSGGFL